MLIRYISILHNKNYNVKRGEPKMEDQVKIALDNILKFAESNPDCFVKQVEEMIKDEKGVRTVMIGITLSIDDDLDE